jgi:hypothetical protein
MSRSLPAGIATLLWGAGLGVLVLGVGGRVALFGALLQWRTWRYRRPPLAA